MSEMYEFDCCMNYKWDAQMLTGHATQADGKQPRNNKEKREEINGTDNRTDR